MPTNDLCVLTVFEDIPINSLQIFDRYGNEDFTANGYDQFLDGEQVKMGDLPKGTYFL